MNYDYNFEGCVCLQDQHYINCPAIETGKCHYQGFHRHRTEGGSMGVTRLSEELTRTMDDLTADVARETNSLTPDKKLALAAYLKYSFGPLCRGMEDGDWLRESSTILNIIQ